MTIALLFVSTLVSIDVYAQSAPATRTVTVVTYETEKASDWMYLVDKNGEKIALDYSGEIYLDWKNDWPNFDKLTAKLPKRDVDRLFHCLTQINRNPISKETPLVIQFVSVGSKKSAKVSGFPKTCTPKPAASKAQAINLDVNEICNSSQKSCAGP